MGTRVPAVPAAAVVLGACAMEALMVATYHPLSAIIVISTPVFPANRDLLYNYLWSGGNRAR